jgi:predicted nucleic acid-binding protein
MNAERIVIDASVAIKWIVSEPGTDEALRLRRRLLFAPDLLIAECANILWKKVRRRELTEVEAILAARLLERAGVRLEPMRRLLQPAISISIALDHPADDCMYLATAEMLSCGLVTADERLYRKCRGVPGVPVVYRLHERGS